jgi:superfamily II DNA/RNA helicase
LIEKAQIETGIVFCNRKTEVDIVAKSLRVHGFDAAAIHGDLDQTQRMKTLADFRSGALKILVASDVAARGLDIPAVSHVFNYDVPHHADDYVHRIGRTGRAGRSGITYMLVAPADDKGFDKVVKLIGSTPDEEKLDLDYSNAVTVKREGDRDRKRGGRDRDRDRGERSERPARGSSRSRGRAEETAVEAPVEAVAAEAPETVVAEPRPPRERKPRREREPRPVATAPVVEAERPGRPERAERPERADRPERSERPERPVRGVQPVRDRDDDDRRVVGFGNDIPAFLAKPPRR